MEYVLVWSSWSEIRGLKNKAAEYLGINAAVPLEQASYYCVSNLFMEARMIFEIPLFWLLKAM